MACHTHFNACTYTTTTSIYTDIYQECCRFSRRLLRRDGFKSVDIDFEVVMDEVVDNVGEVLDWVEGNLLNDDEPSLSTPPLRPSPHRHNLAK